MTFYKKMNGKFVETKAINPEEGCSLGLSRVFSGKRKILIAQICRSGSFESYGMYGLDGILLLELDDCYFSAPNQDIFVGKVSGTDEWKMFDADGNVIKCVDYDDFEFSRGGGIAGSKYINNMSDL